MTLQEAELIKHTAWMNANREPRGCTEAEAQKMTPFVVNAVVYTAVLNGYLYDLTDAMKAERTMDDSAKKVLRMFHRSANFAHGEIYRVFNQAIEGFGKLYNERYDLTTQSIEDHVKLEGGERYFNIVLAVLRLIEKNNMACGRFASPALKNLKPFEKRLLDLNLPYEDKGHVMEVIIEGASKEVLEARRFTKLIQDEP